MTRKVTAHLFHSVNGVVESPDRWQFDAFGPEEGELMESTIGPVTDLILGRKLWQEWSEYWPNPENDDPFSAWINPIRKHVIASTLSGELGWNSTLIDGDPVAYLQSLRETEGGDISVGGGIETVRSLFLAGQIDALTLTTHPAVTGEGRRLFDETVPVTRLSLIDSKITSAGNAVLTYGLRA
ncbi:dihydrofolate reductase family protein [Microlunatus soli]|uniref:Dihydrofolate reductase n=1 Tax=Microlunatus soli TaxID=630515 RepID=A0A1H1WMN2_9ACTN|nr:dihydrofolate reductase family protein [Microlunatus soli]SDS98527.1 Dihydrofolate reductase [Microlunatus soli]